MKHTKKSKLMLICSPILLVLVIFGALYLGGGVGVGVGIGTQTEEIKIARLSSNSWSQHGTGIFTDAVPPINLKYTLGGVEQLIISTGDLKTD